MTDEEHQTRAMLLGMGWDKGMRLYHHGNNKHFSYKNCIDHDTMQSIGQDDWWDRFREARGKVALL